MVYTIPKSGFARTCLIEEKGKIMAVDVGSIGAAQEIEAYCTNILKKSLQDIQFIAATHFHIDHIGGIGTLLQKCSPETMVLFHHLVKEYLAGKHKFPPLKNWVDGLLPTALASCGNIAKPSDIVPETLAGMTLDITKDLDHLPYESSIRYFDASRLPRYKIGIGDWEVISTPGHTEDSVSFYSATTKELICGDLIIGNSDGTGHLNTFCQDETLIKETFQSLSTTISPKVIYPGHGDIIADDENAFRKVTVLSTDINSSEPSGQKEAL